jgi:hypothetical protein
MNKMLLVLPILLLAGCAETTGSSHQGYSSSIGETILSGSTISENVISENIISENIWEYTNDIVRSPNQDELALAPQFIPTFGRFENETKVTSFEYMEEGSFNGLTSESIDPDERGYAVILYMDGEFDTAFGIGLGLQFWAGYTSDVEFAKKVINVEIYINYSVTDVSTKNANDIVSIKVAEFNFQRALIS